MTGSTVALSLAIGIGGLAAAVLAGLGLATFLRRRSETYLLVALALGALFARAVVGAATVAGWLSAGDHHLIEHGLDAVMAALVVAAVYRSRVEPPAASAVDDARRQEPQ
jgi:hypothetical protein